MKPLFILLCFLHICFFSQGQYIINYDVARGKHGYKYVREKDTISVRSIKVSKNTSAFLYLSNFSSAFKDTLLYTPTGFTRQEGLKDPFSYYFEYKKPFGTDATNTELKSQESEAEFMKLMNVPITKGGLNESTALFNNYKVVNKHFNHIMVKLENSLLLSDKFEYLLDRFTELHYNTQVTKEEAKSSSGKLADEIVQGASIKPELFILQAKSNDQQLLRDSLSRLLNVMFNIKTRYSLDNLSDEVIKDSIDYYENIAREKYNRISRIQKGQNDADNLEGLAKSVYSAYNRIQYDNYSRKRQVDIPKNLSAVVLVYTPIIDTINASYLSNNKVTIKMDTAKVLIPILKKGPFRIRNSTGIGFSLFPEYRTKFYVKSENGVNTIRSERGDYFKPMFVNFLNFYMPADIGFRWGGSIGIGIPFENGFSNINYLLGFTTFFGRNDPICLTVGLNGGKIKKLRDLKEGDVVNFTTLDENRNYNDYYRIGYFLGITFNASALKDNLW